MSWSNDFFKDNLSPAKELGGHFYIGESDSGNIGVAVGDMLTPIQKVVFTRHEAEVLMWKLSEILHAAGSFGD